MGAPAIAGALLLAALKLSSAAKANLALTLCSIGFSVYAMELASTIWFRLPSVQENAYRQVLATAAAARGVSFDLRTKSQVVKDMRRDGVDAVPSIFPRGLLEQLDGAVHSVIRSQGAELLPLAGISRKRTVVCNEGGNYLLYTSDEHGFHNSPGLWRSGEVEILAVGDSFVQGWCVPSARNFVSLIGAHHPITLSLGIEGFGPLSMLATLREYGTALKPPVVLWFYFEGNDLGDLHTERASPLMRRYLADGFAQRLVARQSEIDTALRLFLNGQSPTQTRLHDLSTLFSNTKDFRTELGSTLKFTTLRSRLGLIGGTAVAANASVAPSNDRARTVADLLSTFGEILTESKRSVETWGGRIYFVFLPSRDRYDPTGQGPSPDRDPVLARVRAVGLPIIDIAPAFTASGDPMQFFPFRTADHYNEAGHELVARTVLTYLSH
jgi:hypothetical protein